MDWLDMAKARRDGDLEMLYGVLERLGVEVRIEACDSDGGLVRLRGRTILFLNPGAESERKKQLCTDALKRSDTSQLHLPPRVREMLGEGDWE